MDERESPPTIRSADGTAIEGVIARSGPGWLHRLAGADLTYIRVDHQTRLQFDEFEVVVECPFTLELPRDDRAYQLDPEDRGLLGPVLSIYPDALVAAETDTHATLQLSFESGTRLTVHAHDQFEAWQVIGPGNWRVVCVPGHAGELAIWT